MSHLDESAAEAEAVVLDSRRQPHARAVSQSACHENRPKKTEDQSLLGLLDNVCERLGQDDRQEVVNRSLDELILALRRCKLDADTQQWDRLVRMCRHHPLRQILHSDPFTDRAYCQPKGYPGDAKLLDFIYSREERWEAPYASSIGRRIFNYTTAAPAPEGVRARRGFVADLIDRLAEQTRKPHILSIAAGHLREASLSAAVKRGRIGGLVALDSDELSLREVERCYAHFGVETVTSRVRALLTNGLELGRFDLVYTTGLCDYLKQSIGRRLMTRMFGMLRPGGQLLVANFLPGIRDVGYMEAYMNWFLVYRTRWDMVDLTMEVPEREIREVTIFSEENQNITFLQVAKK